MRPGLRTGLIVTGFRLTVSSLTWASLWLLSTSVVMGDSPAASVAVSVDKGLQERAPQILQQLREKGYKNVGVLKFRIKKGNDPVSDRVGTLNMFLADRLEVALILSNSSDPAKQIGIAKKASAVAARIAGASHVTAAGRQKLFEAEYPLSWGDSSVKPDAFLTGIAQISADLKQITVGILVFDSSGGALTKVIPPFDAAVTPSMLGEAGESYVLRGAFDSAKPELVQEKVAEVSAKVKTKEATHPVADPAKPVVLEIQYNGKPIPIEFRDGKAYVPEPMEGQKVALILKRTEHARGRLGVVVKVNGENTLSRQKVRDLDCRKWILDNGSQPITLLGFQMDQNVAEEFRVLSPAESAATEMNYGADVGTISMTVFREVGGEALPEVAPTKPSPTPSPPSNPSTPTPTPKPNPAPDTTKVAKKNEPTPAPPSDLPDDSAEDLVALSRGIQPAKSPKNLAALKFQLREGTRTAETRGLIAQGALIESATRVVQFTPDPTPILSTSIIYYNPKGTGKPRTE